MEQRQRSFEARIQAINGYLAKELQDLNVDTVRVDIPTSSTVKDVQVWSVTQAGNSAYDVVYEIGQTIKEGAQTKDTTSFYMMKVHAGSDGYIIA